MCYYLLTSLNKNKTPFYVLYAWVEVTKIIDNMTYLFRDKKMTIKTSSKSYFNMSHMTKCTSVSNFEFFYLTNAVIFLPYVNKALLVKMSNLSDT